MTRQAHDGGTCLKIWGASGSTPVGFHERAGFGGDTVCLEFQAQGPQGPSVILDLGSGARRLGQSIRNDRSEDTAVHEYDVLLSHLHLDHVIGLPFFAGLFTPGAKVRVHCGILDDPGNLFRTLRVIAAPPYCPIEPLDSERASFHTFAPDACFAMSGFDIAAMPLNHPGGCCGFRFATADGVIAVIGDHEHGDPKIDRAIRSFVKGADVLLYDGCLDDNDYSRFRGWGHSTWQKGVELARTAEIPTLLIYHHLPDQTDDDLARTEARLRNVFEGGRLARQEMSVNLNVGKVTLTS